MSGEMYFISNIFVFLLDGRKVLAILCAHNFSFSVKLGEQYIDEKLEWLPQITLNFLVQLDARDTFVLLAQQLYNLFFDDAMNRCMCLDCGADACNVIRAQCLGELALCVWLGQCVQVRVDNALPALIRARIRRR